MREPSVHGYNRDGRRQHRQHPHERQVSRVLISIFRGFSIINTAAVALLVGGMA